MGHQISGRPILPGSAAQCQPPFHSPQQPEGSVINPPEHTTASCGSPQLQEKGSPQAWNLGLLSCCFLHPVPSMPRTLNLAPPKPSSPRPPCPCPGCEPSQEHCLPPWGSRVSSPWVAITCQHPWHSWPQQEGVSRWNRALRTTGTPAPHPISVPGPALMAVPLPQLPGWPALCSGHSLGSLIPQCPSGQHL